MHYLYPVIFILSLDLIVEQVLAFVNLKHQRMDIPKEVAGFYDNEKYFKSLRYDRELTKLSFYTSAFRYILTVGMFLFGGFVWLDSLLRNVTEKPIPLALLFFGVLLLVADLLMLPFQWYRTFVVEERYGFNTTTLKTFVTDKIKTYLVAAVIGGVLGSALIYLIVALGPGFWIWFTIVLAVFILLGGALYTTLLLPLFNKLNPLPDGELRSAILDYIQNIGFPLDNVYIMDGSKRSKKANAFFSGAGKRKKIILYDTLIQQHSIEQLVAVLAHEVGHYKKKHMIRMYCLSIVQTALILFILSKVVFTPALSIVPGGSVPAIHLNLLVFAALSSPLAVISGMFINIVSRRNELQADAYAGQTFSAAALCEALKKLSVDHLTTLYPHPLYVFFHYSHPPLLQRLKSLETAQAGPGTSENG